MVEEKVGRERKERKRRKRGLAKNKGRGKNRGENGGRRNFFQRYFRNNCRSYRGPPAWKRNGDRQRDSVTGRSVVPAVALPVCKYRGCTDTGTSTIGPVSGTIAVANNQIRALSAGPPTPSAFILWSARSLARSLAPAPANTPDCTPSVFKQTRTPLSPPLSALPCLLAAPFLSALLSSFTPLPLVSLFCFAIRELQSFAFSFLNARSGREEFLNRIIRFNRARFRSLSPRHHPPFPRS